MKVSSKIIIFSIVTFVIVIGVGILFYLKNDNYNSYVTINYNQLLKKVNSNEKFVLFVGSDECSHCTTFKITAKKIAKDYNVEINYINIINLTEEENAYLTSHFPYSGTPTTEIIENGKKVSEMIGAKGYDYTVKFLKANGIIKE